MIRIIASIKAIAITLLFFSIQSCKIGRDYQRPQLELPDQFSGVSFADTSSIADIEWKSFFSDPTLQGLIEQGIRNNYDLQLAIKRINIAELQLKQSGLLQLPDLSFNATAQYNRPSGNSLNGKSANSFLGKNHIEYYSAALALSWEADIWGKIRRQKEASLAQYLQSYEASRAVQTQLVASIAQGYFNLLMLDRQLDITRRNLSLSDSFVVATRLLKDAGVVTALAVQQAESQKQSTSLLIPQLEQQVALQENAVRTLTGQLPGTIMRSAGHLNMADNLSAGLPLAMISRRPDVRAAEMYLVGANARAGIAQANMYPALNLTAGGGFETFTAGNWFNVPGSLFGLAAGTIAQPVFKRGALRTSYRIAVIEREQAATQFRQSALQAVEEVSNALVRVDKLKQQETIAAMQVDTLRKAVLNAQLLFRSDLASYLEVLTAQGNALQAELNLAAIERQRLGAKVELYRSLGGGWK